MYGKVFNVKVLKTIMLNFFNLKMQNKQREPSVRVKEDWKVIEEIEFSRLTKLSLPSVEDPTDL